MAAPESTRHDERSDSPSPARPPRPWRDVWSAVCGVIAMAAFLASAEAVAVVVGASSSPLIGVGSAVIDLAPPGAKQLMVSLFGTGDKAALFALMGVLLVVITALAGFAERARPPVGSIILAVGGALAALAVRTRADASDLDVVPSIVGTLVAISVLRQLLRRRFRWIAGEEYERGAVATEPQLAPALRPSGVERRAFLRFAAVTAAASVVVGVGARVMNAGAVNAAALRARVRLPRAATSSPPIPAGSDLGITGLAPYITPTADFYRIDTALSVPQVDPSTWTLKITGLVDHPLTLRWEELLGKPLVEHIATLSCVSNEVGGDLIGNARWLGYPIRELLAQVSPHPSADMVLSRSVDGFTASTPLSVLQDPGTTALLAVGMNGAPLPLQHGFPVRMVVPGLYGYVSATKWVTSMHVTRFADEQAYWTTRGYSAKAPVKLESRIDTPSNGASVAAGTIAIAGVAWEPHTGVGAVHVRIDGGGWRAAKLADSISDDTWRQWVYRWDAPSGTHTVEVRATDKNGRTQSGTAVAPAPNGAEGWHRISVTVR